MLVPDLLNKVVINCRVDPSLESPLFLTFGMFITFDKITIIMIIMKILIGILVYMCSSGKVKIHVSHLDIMGRLNKIDSYIYP